MSESDDAVVEDKPPRVQAIWILPIVVLVVGLWVVGQSYLNQGPEITITFKTAEGLQAEKTQIKALSVQVGIVEDVRRHRRERTPCGRSQPRGGESTAQSRHPELTARRHADLG